MDKRNAAIRLVRKLIADIKVEVQGLRSPKNRSLLDVNEDFEDKRNAEITLLDNFSYRRCLLCCSLNCSCCAFIAAS